MAPRCTGDDGDFFWIDLGGGGGRDDKHFIHPSMFDRLPLLLYIFADATPMSSSVSMVDGAALVMMVEFVLD